MFSPTRSTISNFNDNDGISRDLAFYDSLNITKDDPNSHRFVSYGMVSNNRNIYGEQDTQARKVEINVVTNEAFKEGYATSGKEGLGATQPARVATSFRLANNIISELVSNYDLFENRVGVPEINSFDLLSRMTLTEFNRLIYIENSNYLFPRVRDGVLSNVKVIPPTKNDGVTFTKKTRIRRIKPGVTPSVTYFPVKASETGQYVLPPQTTEDWSSKFGNVQAADAVATEGVAVAKTSRNN